MRQAARGRQALPRPGRRPARRRWSCRAGDGERSGGAGEAGVQDRQGGRDRPRRRDPARVPPSAPTCPSRMFRRAPRAQPERHGFDYTSLAWAAIIVLAVGVGFLANEVRHARERGGGRRSSQPEPRRPPPRPSRRTRPPQTRPPQARGPRQADRASPPDARPRRPGSGTDRRPPRPRRAKAPRWCQAGRPPASATSGWSRRHGTWRPPAQRRLRPKASSMRWRPHPWRRTLRSLRRRYRPRRSGRARRPRLRPASPPAEAGGAPPRVGQPAASVPRRVPSCRRSSRRSATSRAPSA